ncbi:MAG TPA: carbohydrate porin [Rhodocyclaceae bacterium]|nr:carbohydrate porin [Rhodocyclaceae bacterium]
MAGALALLTIASATEVQAQVETTPDYTSGTLTGDWAGRRSEWSRHGVELELGLKSDWLRNRGGLANGGRPMNQLDIKLKADLEKQWGWSTTTAYIHFLRDWGDRVNTHSTGSIIGISNIEWPINTTRFFQAWLEKSVLDDSLGVLVGLYPFDSEFSALDSGAVFLHPSFGASPDVSLTRGPSIFNNSAFGTRVKWRSPDREIYVQGAVLDGIPGDPSRPKGTHVEFNKGDGSFHIFELGYIPRDGAAELSENFVKVAAGFWGYTAMVDDLVDRDIDGKPVRRHSRGRYVLAEKTVWRDSGDANRNLAIFARYCTTDGDSTAIDRAVNLGVRLHGPISSRPDDILGIAATRANIGAKFRQSQAAAGIDATRDESALEITYRAALRKWLAVQPVGQRIRHPGANRAVPDATVLGARFELVF